MIGAIIGDIAGSRFEFNNYRNKDFEIFSKQSFITDDTVMTLAVAQAVMETLKRENEGRSLFQKTLRLLGSDNHGDEFYSLLHTLTVKYMKEIGREYPGSGYGGMFLRWMMGKGLEPYGSFGNGAAMRISPVGFVAKNVEEVRRMSRAVTSTTHNHPEGIKGAEATAMAIFLARIGAKKEEIRETIVEDYYSIDFSVDELRSQYEFNETCQGTVPQALCAFFESESFEDAIRNAISIGGDSDTIGAITGGVAEAYYGVPDDFVEKALAHLDPKLRGIYENWMRFMV